MLLNLALFAAAVAAAPGQVVLAGQARGPANNSPAELAAPFRCDLPPPVLPPTDDGLPSAAAVFGSDAALQRQVARHRAIVRVPTASYDDMGDVDADPRWQVFYTLHAVLADLFPAVHARMSLTKVNGLGLVFALNGTQPDLRPIMLTAHQDVVPVADDDAAAWTHPPFAGHFDGRFLWGRGASDDKNSLTALLSTLEALLGATTGTGGGPAWTPRRGIVLAFGFDEEVGGVRGASSIAAYLEATYGQQAMVLVLDEGGSGLETVGAEDGDGSDGADGTAALYANIAVVEKGYVNVRMDLRVAGGHASVPPPHSGIGMAAALVEAVEAHPFSPAMAPGSPAHAAYVCRARYSPGDDPELTRLVRADDLAALVDYLVAADAADTADMATLFRRYLLQTSQAVDVVRGGLKINALPAAVSLGINLRVAPQDSIADVQRHMVEVVQPVAARFGLAVEAFGDVLPTTTTTTTTTTAPPVGTLVLTTDSATDVSPIAPSSGAVWDLFAGSIRHTFAFNGTVVPFGSTMNGNTDTRHYHGLTRHVYRWTPERRGASINIHTVDERIDMATHMEMVQFYYNLVRTFDAADV